DLALGQMRKLRNVPPDQSSMVQSLVKRSAAKGITGDWLRRASEVVAKAVYPALDRQIAAMEQLKPRSRTGDGAGRLPDDKAMYGRLPNAFATLPGQPLEIRRVPPEIQDGAANGYYRPATLDGSRPAIYFINLKDLGDWPRYTLPTLCYHEGVPGHHLQLSISQESKDIPKL